MMWHMMKVHSQPLPLVARFCGLREAAQSQVGCGKASTRLLPSPSLVFLHTWSLWGREGLHMGLESLPLPSSQHIARNCTLRFLVVRPIIQRTSGVCRHVQVLFADNRHGIKVWAVRLGFNDIVLFVDRCSAICLDSMQRLIAKTQRTTCLGFFE